MKILRILIAPALAFSLLLAATSLYSGAVHAHETQGDAQETDPDKPAEFHYVCPMHEDVTSKKPGKCRKCKMKLVKKKVKEPVAKPSDQ
jgi:hypothetical protein